MKRSEQGNHDGRTAQDQEKLDERFTNSDAGQNEVCPKSRCVIVPAVIDGKRTYKVDRQSVHNSGEDTVRGQFTPEVAQSVEEGLAADADETMTLKKEKDLKRCGKARKLRKRRADKLVKKRHVDRCTNVDRQTENDEDKTI